MKRFRIVAIPMNWTTDTAYQLQILVTSGWANLYKPARRGVTRERQELQRTCRQLLERGYEEQHG